MQILVASCIVNIRGLIKAISDEGSAAQDIHFLFSSLLEQLATSVMMTPSHYAKSCSTRATELIKMMKINNLVAITHLIACTPQNVAISALNLEEYLYILKKRLTGGLQVRPKFRGCCQQKG